MEADKILTDYLVVVDDEEHVSSYFESYFANNGSNTKVLGIQNCHDFDVFISKINVEYSIPKFFIIDLDLNEDKDGMHILEVVRANEILKNVPAVIYSRFLWKQETNDYYSSGANSVIMKPTKDDEHVEIAEMLIKYWKDLNKTAAS